MANNLSGGTRVHTGHTKVSTNVGVVNIYLGSSSKKSNILVIYNGVSGGRDGSSTEGGGSTKEGTTVSLSVEGSLGRRLGVRGERSSGAEVDKESNKNELVKFT